jgi:GntR family transcriptional repressor for pyruvate dehydrogenase complex
MPPSSDSPPYRSVAQPRRLRLSDAIVAQVEALIADGTLSPGHELPAERELAKQFGVSRPSLREALLRLEARGLLRVARGGGFAVADVTGPTITDPLVHLLRSHAGAERDVLELRHGLEMVAAHFAAHRATKHDMTRLREAYDTMRKLRSRRDPLAHALADAEFHLAIAEASHNVALIHVMHGLHNLLRTTMRHAWELMSREPEGTPLLEEQHRQLFEAIVAGDGERARTAADLHLNYVRESLLQLDGHAAKPSRPPAVTAKASARTPARTRARKRSAA